VITREQGLRSWASRWRTLRAWKRDLSEVTIDIKATQRKDRLGTCWPLKQHIVIYLGEAFIGELGTLIHELAHAATIGAHHDEPWQTVYAAAVTEVTGIAVVPVAYNYEVLNMAAKDALRTWWRTSGNATIWKLASKQPQP
jgi:hypothetical protein